MYRWITDLFVILLYFEIRENCVAAIRVWHDSTSSIDKSSIVKNFKDVPN